MTLKQKAYLKQLIDNVDLEVQEASRFIQWLEHKRQTKPDRQLMNQLRMI